MKRIMIRLKQGFRFFYVNIITSCGRDSLSIPELDFPIHIRHKSSDVLAFHQIFTFKEYDMDLGLIPKFIIDAGANIGLYSVFFSKKFPGSTILAIEPEKTNFEILIKNTVEYANVSLEKKALYNQSNLIFDVVTESKGLSSNSKIVDSVETITIDEILLKYNLEHLDLLKIDIEGGEKDLFESNYENWLPRTKCVIIELLEGITKGSSKSFFKAISKYDFSFFNRGENLLFINNNL